MDYKIKYNKWLNFNELECSLKDELYNIKDDEKEIEDRFYKNLKFGTAGLRGKLGVGSNRMNIYTVAVASKGLADTIINHGQEAVDRGVAIAYDVRYMSKEFAELTASVLAHNGIKSYIYKDIAPTPLLSYTVRELNAIAGVMITASHNPKNYNGYKVYWEEGSQILNKVADEILYNASKVSDYFNVGQVVFSEGLDNDIIEYVSDIVIDNYKEEVLNLSINEDVDKNINIVYSPLNGTGNNLVREVLKARGFNNLYVVEEEELPDPEFTSVGYPNPEDPSVFKQAEELGKLVNADILMATDPDADRIAIEVKSKTGDYVFLNGNQTGALMTNYILGQLDRKGEMPKNPVLIKSIVTGNLSAAIAGKYNVEVLETLVGFKNIYAPVNEWDSNKNKNYVFGYEESIGYGCGKFVRDKDAVSAAMIIAEMAAYYAKEDKSLLDILDELYEEFGYYGEKLMSITLEGSEGVEVMNTIMDNFRNNPLKFIDELEYIFSIDYSKGVDELTKSNTVRFFYEGGTWFAIRPSGTEPKIKFYIYTVSKTKSEGDEMIDFIQKLLIQKVNMSIMK